MTITLSDEQARLLSELFHSGAARSPEEAFDRALRTFHSYVPLIEIMTAEKPVHQQADNLADLFAKSPFRGLDMTFERDRDTGRDISL